MAARPLLRERIPTLPGRWASAFGVLVEGLGKLEAGTPLADEGVVTEVYPCSTSFGKT